MEWFKEKKLVLKVFIICRLFKGYILDGIPSLIELEEGEPKNVTALKNILSRGNEEFVSVLVHLSISDEQLIRRRAGQWLDPKTNILYSGAQVAYSRKRITEGWSEGPDDEAEAEDLYFKSTKVEIDEEEDEENEDKPIEQEKDIFRNRTTWPILSEEILNRLIKRPEDDPNNVAEQLNNYSLNEKWINQLRNDCFDPLNIINIDGSDHPDAILKNLLTRIDLLGLGVYRAPEIKILSQPEGGFRGNNFELIH